MCENVFSGYPEARKIFTVAILFSESCSQAIEMPNAVRILGASLKIYLFFRFFSLISEYLRTFLGKVMQQMASLGLKHWHSRVRQYLENGRAG